MKKTFEVISEFSMISDENQRIALIENAAIATEPDCTYQTPLSDSYVEQLTEREIEVYHKIMEMKEYIKELNKTKKELADEHDEIHEMLHTGTKTEKGTTYCIEDPENPKFVIWIDKHGVVIERKRAHGIQKQIPFAKAV
jgi:hypothetical protein